MTQNIPLPARIEKSWATRYGLSLLAMALALLIGSVLAPRLGGSAPYMAVFPAIAFSAWYCGLSPSAVSSTIALVVFGFSFHTPALDMIALSIAVAIIVALGEWRRRECDVLRRAQGELEKRVRERTAELDTANHGLRELTVRLMHSQDEERRRIARELHDSVGQSLAAMTMNLSTMVTEIERLALIRKAACDSLDLAQDINKEVRTVSYLLHPPLLDEAVLASALRWYTQGFS